MQLRRTWSRPSVRSMAVAAVAGTALLLSGCSEFSPQTTQLQYVPSDGAQGDIGALGIRNALLVTQTLDRDEAADPNAAASFVGTLVNGGENNVTVNLRTADGAQTSIPVPARGSVQLSPEAEQQWQLDQVGVVPGRSVQITVDVAGQQIELAVPVLDGTLPEYATLAPAPAASPAAEGENAASGEAATGEATGTPTTPARPTATATTN